MKIIWNPAITLDGYIAKLDGDSDWVSEQDSELFRSLVKQAGCGIVGRTTYEQYKGDVFPVAGAVTFVLTTHPETGEPNEGLEFVSATPEELITQLAARGFGQVVLAGGGKTNSEFVAAGLVDEIIANIYPITFGEGIKLTAPPVRWISSCWTCSALMGVLCSIGIRLFAKSSDLRSTI